MGGRKVSKNVENYVKRAIKRANNRQTQTKRTHTQFDEETLQSGTTLPSIKYVNHVAQGNNENQRIGNELTGVGFRIRLFWHNKVNPENNARATWCRCALIAIDNEDLTDVRESLFNKNGAKHSYSSATGVERYYLPFNEMNRKVLYQKTFKLAAPYSGDTYVANKIIKHYRKYQKKMIFESNLFDVPQQKVVFVYFIGNANFDADVPGEPATVEVSGGITFYYKDA